MHREKEATHVAIEVKEYGPVQICAADDSRNDHIRLNKSRLMEK
jgi:hypothetical protein